MSAEEQATTTIPATEVKKEESFSEATLTKVSQSSTVRQNAILLHLWLTGISFPLLLDTQSLCFQYKTAGELANKAIQKVIELSVEGATILSLCKAGDEAVEEATKTVYKSDKKMSKGESKEQHLIDGMDTLVSHSLPKVIGKRDSEDR